MDIKGMVEDDKPGWIPTKKGSQQTSFKKNRHSWKKIRKL